MNNEPAVVRSDDWMALTMGLFLGLGAAIFFTFSALLGFFGLSALVGSQDNGSGGLFILAGGILGLGILLVPGAYMNLRKFFTGADWFPKLPGWDDRFLVPVLVACWLVILVFGQLIVTIQFAAVLFLPILNFLALGLPIIIYLRISLRRLDLPSARRGWSVFGSSLIIAPLLALIFEAIAVIIIALLYLLYASNIPGLKDVFMTMIESIRMGSMNENEAMRMAASFLFAPGAAFATLAVFSVSIPLIEETCKITVLLFFLRRIPRPVDGFVLGILCGAAFAMSENLGFTSSGSADWAANAAARATSALPHILNSGLLGWGIVSAYKEHRYGRLAGAFLAVVIVHGSWNAISLGLAMNSISSFEAQVPSYLQNAYPWLAGWIVLAIGALGGLIFNNSRMRSSSTKQRVAESIHQPTENTGQVS